MVAKNAPLNVLVVDDSAVVRESMTAVLSRDPAIQVMVASDPLIALEKMRRARPDVIVLDLEMPRMHGLDFLRKIMTEDPIPVVVCSGFTARGTAAALRALQEGAIEIVAKPEMGVRDFLHDSAVMLIHTVRAASQAILRPGLRAKVNAPEPARSPAHAVVKPAPVKPALVRPAAMNPALMKPALMKPALMKPALMKPALMKPALMKPAATSPPVPQSRSHALLRPPISRQVPAKQVAAPQLPAGGIASKVVAIGASTGGTEALRELLEAMPPDGPGIVIVQHMPPVFTAAFAASLNNVCSIEVKEAVHGDRVLTGRALVAPGNMHMSLMGAGSNYIVALSNGPLVSGHRPSVDVLFQSVAKAAGRAAVGVILTGMGGDGADGLLEMKRAGALTIAQDEATCVVFGMPKEAIARGAADDILPLPQIASMILRRAFGRDVKARV